jgi:hypothetical protein
MLPDVALIEIFDSYMDGARIDAWHTLVHVCRNWRDVAFRSPRRLNLQLYCKARTPVRELLDIWPLLPIVVKDYGYESWDEDNVIAALEHNDRICDFHLARVTSAQLEKVLAAVQQPFPALTRLQLGSQDGRAPIVPGSFLGGSTPRLQSLVLDGIPFPGLPTLLLSATHLIHLHLWRIPHSGYISPEAMVTSPHWPASKKSPLNSNPLYLTLIGKAGVCLRRHALSFPLSYLFGSRVSANIWTTLWPGSIPLDSTTCI